MMSKMVTNKLYYDVGLQSYMMEDRGYWCILPPWIGGYSLTHDWAVTDASLACSGLSYVHRLTGAVLGYGSERHVLKRKLYWGNDYK